MVLNLEATDDVHIGINGVKNKIDQVKIKTNFELINSSFKPIKSVFIFRKNGLGQ